MTVRATLIFSSIFLFQAIFAQAVKIMPLGNSITQANSSNYSYRYNLWKKLIDEVIEFDYVGSLNSNSGGNPNWPDYQGKSFDRDHEGHWGWTTDEILAQIDVWAQAYVPDIVLLHLGTNDLQSGQGITSTIDELSAIIDTIRNYNPYVYVFLAQIIPGTYSNNHLVPDFNDAIAVASSLCGDT